MKSVLQCSMIRKDIIKYNLLFKNLPSAFAYHKIVRDNNGRPKDYIFLEINDAFEEITGLSRDQVIGRRVTAVHPGIEESAFDWIKTYGEVSSKGSRIHFEQYFEIADRWYEITAYSDTPGHFAVIFNDITRHKRIEKRYEQLARQSRTFDWEVDLSATYTYVSPLAEEIIGYRPEELEGKKTVYDLMPQNARRKFRSRILHILKSREDFSRFDNPVATKNGEIVWVSSSGVPVFDKDGNLSAFRGSDTDITERKQTEIFQRLSSDILSILNRGEEDFRESMRLILTAIKNQTGCNAAGIRINRGEDFPYFSQNGFSRDFMLTENSLVERAPDGSICRNDDGTISLECTCGLVISGRTERNKPNFTTGGSFWTNDSLPLLNLPEKQDPRRNPRNRCVHEGYSSLALIPIRMKTRIIGLLQLNGKAKGLFSSNAIIFLEGIAAHIGEALLRKQEEDEIRYLSFHDSLTGLYNRRYAEEEMRRLDTRRQMPISIIMGDLNGLKRVNDKYGHAAGDRMLQKTALALKESCRGEDIISRWGGDEFIVLLPRTTEEKATGICERIKDVCREKSSTAHPLSVALGVGEKRDAETSLVDVLKEAEKEMYRDKAASRTKQD